MSRLNNIIKFTVWQMNTHIGMIGFLIFCAALYVLFADWGNLSRNFFLGLGVVTAFFGVVLMEISSFGALGIEFQGLTTGRWRGKRILFIFLLSVVAGFVGTAYALFFSTNQVTSLEITREELLDGQEVPYDGFESAVALKFNEFFFGTAAVCAQLNTLWFWTFVDNFCPAAMSQENCVRCGDSWITTCYVDETTCYADYDVVNGGAGVPGENPTCPYEACRIGMLDYFSKRVEFFTWALLGLLCIFLILVITGTLLLCYSKKDSVEDMLVKSGAITRKTVRKSAPPPADPNKSVSPNGRPRTPGRFSVIQAAMSPRGSIAGPGGGGMGAPPANVLSPTAAAIAQATQAHVNANRRASAATPASAPMAPAPAAHSSSAKTQPTNKNALRSPATTAGAKGGAAAKGAAAQAKTSATNSNRVASRAFFPESKI